MDEIVADAIRLLVDVMKKRGDYVKGSRVDGAIRLLECELFESHAVAAKQEVK